MNLYKLNEFGGFVDTFSWSLLGIQFDFKYDKRMDPWETTFTAQELWIG